jgi:hypothetical protein
VEISSVEETIEEKSPETDKCKKEEEEGFLGNSQL